MNEQKLKAAIAYLGDTIRETDEIMPECFPALQAELTEQRGHYVVAIEAMQSSLPDNKALTVEPCWCKDCEYWVPDTDPEDGEQYHRCGNDDSPHGYELTGERNTCPECKRHPPEKGE